MRGWSWVVGMLLGCTPTLLCAAPVPSSPTPHGSDVEDVTRGGPTAPPQLEIPKTPELFNCDRAVAYQGQVFNCDTYTTRDGERLRPVLSQVPAALSELDFYQAERRSLRTAAYVGSAGLLSLIAGIFINKFANPDDGSNLAQAISVMRWGGLAVTGSALVYGFVTYRVSENRLMHAIDTYNQARPRDPLTIQFSPTNF